MQEVGGKSGENCDTRMDDSKEKENLKEEEGDTCSRVRGKHTTGSVRDNVGGGPKSRR